MPCESRHRDKLQFTGTDSKVKLPGYRPELP